MRKLNANRDEGFALVLVLGVIALITAVSVTGYAVASQTLHNSSRVSSQNLAYQAASTGLEQEISFFDPDNLGQYPKAVTLNATDRYEVDVVDVGGGVYEMQSTGTSAGQTELVLVRFQYLNLWDMNYAGGGGGFAGTSGFNGNSTVIGPLYITGDVDWTSNGRMWGGPVFIREGTWNDSGNGQIGDSANRVDAYGPVPSDNVRYFTDPRGAAPELDFDEFKLAADSWQAYRTLAERSSTNNPRGVAASAADPVNMNATYYTRFDGDTEFNTPFGDSATDALAVVGNTLHIGDGEVVYVDGTLTIGPNIRYYSGNGVIFARGGMVINGSLLPAGGQVETLYGTSNIPKMTADDLLGLLTLGDIEFDSQGNWLVGAVLANGQFHAPRQCNVRGSIICNSIAFDLPNSFLCTQQGLSGLFANPSNYPSLSGFTAQSDWIRR